MTHFVIRNPEETREREDKMQRMSTLKFIRRAVPGHRWHLYRLVDPLWEGDLVHCRVERPEFSREDP